MKIVCDFKTIRAELEKINSAIAEMDSALNTYSSSIETSLSSWTGPAKEAFELTNTEQVETTDSHVSDLEKIHVFVSESVDKIEELENALAGLQI